MILYVVLHYSIYLIRITFLLFIGTDDIYIYIPWPYLDSNLNEAIYIVDLDIVTLLNMKTIVTSEHNIV